jgi:hypothetical protein
MVEMPPFSFRLREVAAPIMYDLHTGHAATTGMPCPHLLILLPVMVSTILKRCHLGTP